MASQYDVLLKLLLVGDTGVGKTCLVCRYTTDEYMETHISTLGIDFKTKILPVDNKMIKAQIWDTAGQERFESITKQFYRKAQGILVVYDITNLASFKSVEKWISYIDKLTDDPPCLLLIGNKSDKDDGPRQVQYDEASKMADTHNMLFYEVSAKNSENIDDAFVSLMREVLRKYSLLDETFIYHEEQKQDITQPEIIKIDKEKEASKTKCCVIM